MSRRRTTRPLVDSPGRFSPARIIGLLLAIGVAAALIRVALDIPEEGTGLADAAAERVPDSGVTHPVTAVLLNFRAYDTFLEIAVLVLGVLGVLAVRRESDLRSSREMEPSPLYSDPMLDWLVRLLAPVLVLAGGYLLWLGSSAPGGAFQAGAILAAAGVVLRMWGHPSVAWLSGNAFRILLMVGFLVFLTTGILTMLFSNNIFEFPERGAGLIIIVIETALTISIAVTLTAMFVGAKPPYRDRAPDEPEEELR